MRSAAYPSDLSCRCAQGRAWALSLAVGLVATASGCESGILSDERPIAVDDGGSSAADDLEPFRRDDFGLPDPDDLGLADSDDDAAACRPVCWGQPCGVDDGCGGTCVEGSGCCLPRCEGLLCGADDSCGGTCADGSGCCLPRCEGLLCGADDGCQGICEAGSGCCTPDCAGALCGADDGCGGRCETGQGCCAPACANKRCGANDGCGGICEAGSGCCTPDCAGKRCGTGDGCGGACQAGSGCCTPQCAGKRCGAGDGCGGTCRAGSGCCTPVCAGKHCGASDGCGGICRAGSGCLRPCTVGGVTLKHGQSRVCYSRRQVPFGSSCDGYSQWRKCTDGTLSGSLPYPSCVMKKLRVLLWNILVAGWEHSGIAHWDSGRREKVIALAKLADTDVMLLQEVTPGMYQDLQAAFSADYVSHYRQKTAGSLHGNAIFSKLALSNRGGFTIDDRGRNCASAVINGVNIYSCHLPNTHYSDAYRIAAAKVVASRVRAPLVLGGDFNTQGNIGIYGIVKGPYNGCGHGVDHLFTDRTCSIERYFWPAVHDYPSDHAGIVLSVPQ